MEVTEPAPVAPTERSLDEPEYSTEGRPIPELTGHDLRRFRSKFIPQVDGDNCWRWLGRLREDGYGQFDLYGRAYRAHRVAYTIRYGAIPDGKQINHRCGNPICVRPSHLYAGTHAENMRDSIAHGTHCMASKTHCKHGHEFTEENTSVLAWRGQSHRVCRTCRRLSHDRRKAEETPAEREARREKKREHHLRSRENETPAEREARLARKREYNFSQREKAREYMRKRRENETPAEREARREYQREYDRKRFENEPPAEREARREKAREYNRKRQKLRKEGF